MLLMPVMFLVAAFTLLGCLIHRRVSFMTRHSWQYHFAVVTAFVVLYFYPTVTEQSLHVFASMRIDRAVTAAGAVSAATGLWSAENPDIRFLKGPQAGGAVFLAIMGLLLMTLGAPLMIYRAARKQNVAAPNKAHVSLHDVDEGKPWFSMMYEDYSPAMRLWFVVVFARLVSHLTDDSLSKLLFTWCWYPQTEVTRFQKNQTKRKSPNRAILFSCTISCTAVQSDCKVTAIILQ
jgi:hypothetical protein